MFDKLVELIIQWIEQLLPIVIIPSYEEGVRLSFGKFKKVLHPGIHFKIPFFDEILRQHVVVTTISLPAQSLYTLDRQNFVVKGVIKYKISDVKTFLLEVYDAKDALSDMTMSIIKNIVISIPAEKCIDPELDVILTKKARVEAKKWGVEIQQVTLTDVAPIRSYRLINDINPHRPD
jgi:regulator of protease activity HflC (stomatin/prohibitin superfamily)